MKIIGEGAEARIFETRLMGIDAVVKSRIRKGYRAIEIDEALRTSRTRMEARVLCVVHSAGISAPHVLLVTNYEIFMTRVRGKNLSHLIRGMAPGWIDKTIALCGDRLGALHKIDVVHGDYTPANIMVDSAGKPSIIDFGLSEVTQSVEEKALDVLLMKRSLDKARFGAFVRGYESAYGGHKAVEDKLAEIERRGRYQARTMETA